MNCTEEHHLKEAILALDDASYYLEGALRANWSEDIRVVKRIIDDCDDMIARYMYDDAV